MSSKYATTFLCVLAVMTAMLIILFTRASSPPIEMSKARLRILRDLMEQSEIVVDYARGAPEHFVISHAPNKIRLVVQQCCESATMPVDGWGRHMRLYSGVRCVVDSESDDLAALVGGDVLIVSPGRDGQFNEPNNDELRVMFLLD